MRIVRFSPKTLVARQITLSGTVDGIDESNNVRRILAYRNGSTTEVHASTVSASNGAFSLEVNGSHNDVFRLVALGVEGVDNSAIFDHVRESV